jgi:rhodanese-related sulfurtransferase
VDEGSEATGYQIISVRAEDAYRIGHIPGAINIPWRTIVDDDSLSELGEGPIIVYCYTGHAGQVAATILGLMGYDVVNMKYGMMGWTTDPEVLGVSTLECKATPYETEAGENQAQADHDLPGFDTDAETAEAMVQARAAEFLHDWVPTISPADVQGIIDEPALASEYVIVSVRSPEDYVNGHVPGAINIPWKTLADEGSLELLPPEKTIITYCYTGHTGQIAATVLKLLSYDAVNMQYGMMAWNEAHLGTVAGFDCDAVPDYQTTGGR